MKSFLNIIDLETGRQIRVAELGYRASSPSFTGGGITFRRASDGKAFILSLENGMVLPFDGEITPDPEPGVFLKYNSQPEDGIAYVELTSKKDGRVIARFMGGEDSLGEKPVDEEGRNVVFFGYPAE